MLCGLTARIFLFSKEHCYPFKEALALGGDVTRGHATRVQEANELQGFLPSV